MNNKMLNCKKENFVRGSDKWAWENDKRELYLNKRKYKIAKKSIKFDKS